MHKNVSSKNLVDESVHYITQDVRFVRMTFLTSFFHSLIVILLIVLNIQDIFATRYKDGLYIGKMSTFFIQEVISHHVVSWVIGIVIVGFLLYSILYPLGQTALIWYVKHGGSIRKALKVGWEKFFSMFEFSFISLVFSPVALFIFALKMIADGNFGFWLWFFMILWFVILNIVNVLKSYTRYFLVLEDMSLYDALLASYRMTYRKFLGTWKYMRMQTILLINFSINLLIVLGIPLLLMYLAIRFDIIYILWVKYTVYLIFLLLVILGSYASTFIRAFFVLYWYKLYQEQRKLF